MTAWSQTNIYYERRNKGIVLEVEYISPGLASLVCARSNENEFPRIRQSSQDRHFVEANKTKNYQQLKIDMMLKISFPYS